MAESILAQYREHPEDLSIATPKRFGIFTRSLWLLKQLS